MLPVGQLVSVGGTGTVVATGVATGVPPLFVVEGVGVLLVGVGVEPVSPGEPHAASNKTMRQLASGMNSR
jgi:hypothetical protein